MTRARPGTALLPAGDRFEDFFDKVGVTLESFRHEQTGGWLFNYVEALRSGGCDTALVFMSARVTGPVRFVHQPTGCRVSVLPSPSCIASYGRLDGASPPNRGCSGRWRRTSRRRRARCRESCSGWTALCCSARSTSRRGSTCASCSAA